jgi:hypothetical protein
MRRFLFAMLVLSVFVVALPVHADEAGLLDGVGEAPGSLLSMRFKVSIFRIDIADVTARVDAATALALEDALGDEDLDDESFERCLQILHSAPELAVTMEYLRDSDWKRFQKGRSKQYEYGVKAGLLNKEEATQLLQQFETQYLLLRERSVLKSDRMLTRRRGDSIQFLHVDASGQQIHSALQKGDLHVRAFLGGYLSTESPYARKLVESLTKDD